MWRHSAHTLERMLHEMKYKTWDGGEGEPDPRLVTSITVAQAFIEALPDYVEEPKMNFDPAGQIEFEWYHDNVLLLMVEFALNAINYHLLDPDTNEYETGHVAITSYEVPHEIKALIDLL